MRTGTEEKTPLSVSSEKIQAYLRQVFGDSAKLSWLGEIGQNGLQGMKEFGYGKPLRIEFSVNGRLRSAVLSIMRGDKYGHQFYWDRAAILMFQHETAGRMPKHAKPMGLGYFDVRDKMTGVLEPKEFFILNELVDGDDYYKDLERIGKEGATQDDIALVRDFAGWLAEIHAQKADDPDLYLRRIRNLIGASECIFGLVDAYPYPYDKFLPERFQALEKRVVDWRWKLRKYTHRLSVVHGDFHPWNTLVRKDDDGKWDFSVLDRSRGEFGEPADDVSTMSLNFVLFALYGQTDKPRLSGDFERLYIAFWEEYLSRTGDEEILEVIAPFYVFRGLVIASPQWYPHHPEPVRAGLLRFLERVLEDERFDWRGINKYLE
ncbi:MAG: phosphotransferase [Desulfovibrio sp.]|nr:phosphotransferase [Desulfovibrio sp.]MBI4960064.1 phosphotransferase [Desulfovibrio sp.]